MNDKTRNILRIAGLATAIGLTLLYGLAVAWYCTPVMREVTCDSLHIVMRDGKELHFITENDVHDFITSQHIHVIGMTMNIESMHRIEACIEEMNMVKRAECWFDNEGCLIINIWQRTPVFRVIGSQHSYYVDSQRTRMPFSRNYTAYLPVVSGQLEESFAVNELYDFIVYLQGNSFWKNHIGQIAVKNNNELVLGTKSGVSRIEFGSLDHYEEKLRHLQAWYEQYPDKAFSDEYASVNVKYKGLIYCKRTEK